MRLRRGCRGAWIALAAVLVDRLTKAAARASDGRGPLIPGIVNLRPVENRGVAFSMLWGKPLLLALFTALLIAGVVGWLIARPGAPRLARTGLWLIVGGGLGNLYDRVVYGSVTDFIDLAFVRFAVFNVADVFICVGAALVVISAWKNERKGT